MLILVCVISIQESVAESFLFGLPSFKLKRRTRLRFLPSAAFNA
jgi:energy-converting hydrogenase Eha subunit A